MASPGNATTARSSLSDDDGEDAQPLAAGAHVDRYQIVSMLGAGAMGVVYRARDLELARDVALKLIRTRHLSLAEARARLRREAQAMARLEHPRVVRVYDVGAVGDKIFVAMELVAGGTLRRWLEDGPRPWRDLVPVLIEAGEGLAAAHAAGLVHRDFKPENVLVDGAGRPRVTDFGLARLLADDPGDQPVDPELAVALDHTATPSLTSTGGVVGTPAYMPPEQLLGRRIDARADQFAFCVVLWEALFGQRPFRIVRTEGVPRIAALAAEIEAGRIQPPPRGSRVPRRLRELVARGLAASPDARWRSMDDLLAAIAGVSRRRQRLVVGVTAGVLAIGLAAGIAVMAGRQDADPVADAEARLTVGTAFALAHDRGDTGLESISMLRDGRTLVYTQAGKVWTQPRGGGDRHPLEIVPGATPIYTVPAAAENSLLVRTHDGGACGWWEVSLTGAPARKLLDDPGCDRQIDLSPDRQRLAIASGTRLAIRDLASGADTTVQDLPLHQVSAPVWSPDGRRLAYVGAAELRVIEVASGAVLARRSASPGGRWLDDATIVYTQAQGLVRAEIRALRLDGADRGAAHDQLLHVIQDEHVLGIDVSAAGLLIWTQASSRRVYLVPRAAETPAQLHQPRPLDSGASTDFLVAGWFDGGDALVISLLDDRRALIRVGGERLGATQVVHDAQGISSHGGNEATSVYLIRSRAGDTCQLRAFDKRTAARRSARP